MQTLKKQHTLAEYRSLEETAKERHEYHDGTIIAMTGGTLEHSAISGNIYTLLKYALRKSLLKPFNSNLRVWISRYQRGVYPDVMVIEGEPRFNDGRRDEVTNPKLVVEVLSRSTEAYDRGDKFMYYRSIPEFSEYVLINQYQPWVDHYFKTNSGDWSMRSYEGIEATMKLATVSVQISLAEIYEDIVFVEER
jgi:Uma2 family endonuclease